MKFILIAGHSNNERGDRGAFSPQFGAEGFHTVLIRDLVAKELSTMGYEVATDAAMDNESRLWVVERYCREIAKVNDVLIDIHLNAFSNPSARGVESYVPLSPSALEVEIAEKLSATVANALGTVTRMGWKMNKKGVKYENESQHPRLWISSIPCHTVLLETCFLTNPKEMQVLTTERERVCKSIAETLSQYGTKKEKAKEKAV